MSSGNSDQHVTGASATMLSAKSFAVPPTSQRRLALMTGPSTVPGKRPIPRNLFMICGRQATFDDGERIVVLDRAAALPWTFAHPMQVAACFGGTRLPRWSPGTGHLPTPTCSISCEAFAYSWRLSAIQPSGTAGEHGLALSSPGRRSAATSRWPAAAARCPGAVRNVDLGEIVIAEHLAPIATVRFPAQEQIRRPLPTGSYPT